MKIKILMILFVLLSLGMNGCIVEEEEMPYIPSEDEIELTATLEEDVDYYIFTTDIQYLNSKVESGHITYFMEFNSSTSTDLESLLTYGKEATTQTYINYINQLTYPDQHYLLFWWNEKNTDLVPGKDRVNLYAYSGTSYVQTSYKRADNGEIVSREYPFVYTKYWIPKNQDFRLDTLSIVIEHWDYTGSNSTKSVYKEIPFVHTLEGTAE